MQISMRYFEYC